MAADLLTTLRVRGRQQAGELLALLGVSRPTLMRLVAAAGGQVMSRGQARRTTYAARRALRGALAPLPVYRVGLDGNPTEVARLHLTVPDGCAADVSGDLGWPLDPDMRDGWFDGLPYFLHDMRPQGFIGRHFARHHAALLQVDEDPTRWSDDDVLHALSLLGADTIGNLILGEPACRAWLEQLQQARAGSSPPGLEDAEVAAAYPRLADEAMAAGLAGSSAGGEHPKFTALRQGPARSAPRQVLVKFSGSDDAPGTRRWADLLVCEHLAGQALQNQLGLPASTSSVHQHGGRTFLEVTRFDRHGLLGRSALVSWGAINTSFFGACGGPWPEGAARLVAQGWLSAIDAGRLARLWHFGQLIGNTDMHDGNLSFQPMPGARAHEAMFQLAPAYDMLPMLYAPVPGAELPPRRFAPRLPLPAEQAAWQEACSAAIAFWQTAATDARVSAGFQAQCADNARTLRRLLAQP